jgi:hypothetical protein
LHASTDSSDFHHGLLEMAYEISTAENIEKQRGILRAIVSRRARAAEE